MEVNGPDDVATAGDRLARQGLATRDESQVTCCFAVQDKVWVEDPDGAPWEVYTVLADAPVESGREGDGSCCADTTGIVAGACC